MVPWLDRYQTSQKIFPWKNAPAYFVSIASDKYEKFYIIHTELELHLAVTYPATTGCSPQ